MIISLIILGFIFLFVFVVYMFKLDALITNIDFEQIDERCHDTVRRRWFIWTEMMIVLIFIWSSSFYQYRFHSILLIIGVCCWLFIYYVGLHYLTKKFKKG